MKDEMPELLMVQRLIAVALPTMVSLMDLVMASNRKLLPIFRDREGHIEARPMLTITSRYVWPSAEQAEMGLTIRLKCPIRNGAPTHFI